MFVLYFPYTGRRGVFDGTVENMHLHWKYRELVKIITNERSFKTVHDVARTLEAESGGILVAVERVNRSFAIIIYRGKNYKRPSRLRPESLLNKKEALKRSMEAQRRKVRQDQSIFYHVYVSVSLSFDLFLFDEEYNHINKELEGYNHINKIFSMILLRKW